jgi:hypothetical protein
LQYQLNCITEQAHGPGSFMTAIPDELIVAYRATHYRVCLPEGDITLRVDAYCEPLAKLHTLHGAGSSAFITAWNPYSRRASQQENIIALQALLFELNALGLRWINGEGEAPSGEWPAEPSLLILGVDHQSAQDIAMQFRQNAFLFCAADAIPRLVLTR